MFDEPVFKMYKSEIELEKIKKEIEKIQKQNNELKNEISFKDLGIVKQLQSNTDVLKQTITNLSNRVSKYSEKIFELNEDLRKLNEKLNKNDTISSQHNGIPEKQNETNQILNTNKNNFGGSNEKWKLVNSLLILENNGQNWKQLNIKLPYAMCGHGAQFLNNNLYIFGGYGKGECLNLTYKLPKSLKWGNTADMNEKRCYISNSSVILNNQIWVCGGFNGNEILKSVEVYDLETNKWKYVREMNESKDNAAAAVVSGKIFCSDTYRIECYDPSSDVWTFIHCMLYEIYGHRAVEIDGKSILMGGVDEGGFFDNVWALHTRNGNAVWKPSMSIPRRWFGIAKIDGKIFVCGKRDANDSVEIFDIEVWRDGPKMPTIRWFAPAVAIPVEFARDLEQFTAAPIQAESKKRNSWKCSVQ